MIWILLLSIIYGGTQSPFLDVNFEKHIKSFVKNEEEKKRILTIYNSSKGDVALYIENEKKNIKELEYQFEQQSTDEADLTQAFLLIGERQKELQSKMINSRLKMQKHIKEDEWNLILSAIENDLRANEKDLDNTTARLESRFGIVRGILKKVVKDENRSDLILDAYGTHELLVMDLSKDIRKHRLYDNPTLQNIQASRQELEQVINERNQFSFDLYKTYISLHQVTAENTESKEWREIIREVKVIFK